MLHQSSMDLKEFERKLFEIITRHEITGSPLREYIEEWLKKALIKINEPKNQETIATIMPPEAQNASTKEALPSK